MALGGSTGFILRSRLPRDEVVRRLRAHVAPGWAVFSGKPAMGHVSRRFLWLRVRSNSLGRNAMQPYLFARLSDDAGGTVLACRCLLHPVSLLFLVMWLVVLVATASVFGTAAGGSYLPVLAIIAGFAILIASGRHFARNDRETLRSFLGEAIDAQPPTGSSVNE